jgi:hypothetical protein
VSADDLRGLLGPSASDPAEAATRCVLLARSCAAAFSTVATKAPPALAIRCDRAAAGIARVIRREFKVRP